MASRELKIITGKYNTSKPLTEVKISCPCGLQWKWQASFPDGIGREARALDWIQKCTANFRTHSLRTTQEGVEIQLETLTDMLPLLQATQNPPPEIGSRSLVYNPGPWWGDNLLTGIDFFPKKTPTIHSPSAETQTAGKRDPSRYQQHPILIRNKPPPHEE